MSFTQSLEQAVQLYQQKQFQAAIHVLTALLQQKLSPDQQYLVYKTMAGCYFSLDELAQSAAFYRRAIAACCAPYMEEKTMLYSNYLFLLHYLPDWSDADLAKEHFAYQDLLPAVRPFVHERKNKQQLRIGYLSPDFCEHVNMFFLIQLLACYDRERYEVICYAAGDRSDNTTQQLRQLVDGWRDVAALAPAAAAKQIYADGIDILFDLSGHAAGGATLPILRYKPAPIQVCGIGYMSTTGLAAVDYFLTDGYCDPPGHGDALFTERLVRLPHTHLCYTPSERALHCQREYAVHSPIVFGSFNNFAKITDAMLRLWLRILRQVPASRLILKGSGTLPFKLEALQRRAQQVGFLSEQLELRPGSGDYLDAYQDIDIALDTYPYGGGGTTCDALYMGVPVVSLTGTRHGTRFGYSLLMNLGLGELAADTPEAYVERAVALAGDPGLLAGLHQILRPMMEKSPLMNGRQYVHEVEAAYEAMWRDWLAGR